VIRDQESLEPARKWFQEGHDFSRATWSPIKIGFQPQSFRSLVHESHLMRPVLVR